MVAKPEPGGGGPAGLREVGPGGHADRRGDRRRHLSGQHQGVDRRGHSRVSGWSTDCPSTIPRRARATRSPALRRAAAPTRQPEADLDLALELLLDARRSRASAGSTSSTTPPCSATTVLGPGRRRRRAPRARHRLRARRHQTATAASVPRPLRGRQGRGRRGGAQRRLHRRPPDGITNCLNFGNPEKPGGLLPVPRGVPRHGRRLPRVRHAGHRRQRLVLQRESHRRGLSHADHRHGRPDRARSTAGCRAISPPRRRDRLLGETRGELGGTAYWAELHGFVGGRTPPVDLDARAPAPAPAGRGRRAAAAPVGPRLPRRRPAGGARRGGDGRRLRARQVRRHAGSGAVRRRRRHCDALLFGEDAGRVVVSCRPGRHGAALAALAAAHGVPISRAGVTGGPGAGTARRVPAWSAGTWLASRRTYYEAIPRRMQHADAERSAGE